MPATSDMETAYRQNNSVLKARSSASTPRTPHSSHTIQTSNTNANTALSGARFYIDPDLTDDLQAKVNLLLFYLALILQDYQHLVTVVGLLYVLYQHCSSANSSYATVKSKS